MVHANFEEFYQTRYRELCWSVHGSAAAGIRGLPADIFPGIAVLALRDCCDFAQQSAERTLRYLGLWSESIESLFQKHVDNRKLQSAEIAGVLEDAATQVCGGETDLGLVARLRGGGRIRLTDESGSEWVLTLEPPKEP